MIEEGVNDSLKSSRFFANGELRALDGVSIRLTHSTGQSHSCDLGSIRLNALAHRVGIMRIQQKPVKFSRI